MQTEQEKKDSDNEFNKITAQATGCLVAVVIFCIMFYLFFFMNWSQFFYKRKVYEGQAGYIITSTDSLILENYGRYDYFAVIDTDGEYEGMYTVGCIRMKPGDVLVVDLKKCHFSEAFTLDSSCACKPKEKYLPPAEYVGYFDSKNEFHKK